MQRDEKPGIDMSFWTEIKKRNVVKVAAAYAIVGWLLMQVVSVAFPALQLPPWTVTFVIVVIIIAFPLALVLAWAYELTPEGIKRAKDVPLGESARHVTGQRLNYAVMGLLALTVTFLIVDNYVLDDSDAGSTLAANGEANATTVFVLPFENLSSDPEQAYVANGLTVELIDTLQRLPGLRLPGQATSFAFRGRSMHDISAELGVQYVLEGSVGSDGDRLRVRLQLTDAATGFGVWPYRYDGRLENVFDVQDEIVSGIASELRATLGLEQALRGATTNSLEAYELYLAARSEVAATTLESGARALDLLERALRLDPEFAEAWSQRSTVLGTRTVALAEDEREAALADAAEAALRAIALAPDQGHGYAARGQVRGIRGDWLSAEGDYQEARKRGFSVLSHAILLLSAGRLEEGHEAIEQLLDVEPLSPEPLGFLVLSHELAGNPEAADAVYRQGRRLYDPWFGDFVSTWVRLGRDEVGPAYEELVVADAVFPVFAELIDDPEEALALLNRLAADPEYHRPAPLANLAIWAAYFRDPHLALRLLEEAVSDSATSLTYLAWLPVFDEVRQLPAFKDFLIEIGLVDFWHTTGWPDVCRPAGSDFDCA